MIYNVTWVLNTSFHVTPAEAGVYANQQLIGSGLRRNDILRDALIFDGDNRRHEWNKEYTAVIKQEGKWWVGWIEEAPAVNCQEKDREELPDTLESTLKRKHWHLITKTRRQK